MNDTTSHDDLRALEAAATPGEWEAGDVWVFTRPIYPDDNRLCDVLGMEYADPDRQDDEHARGLANAALIAAARNALPGLLDENAALTARLAEAEGALARVQALADEFAVRSDDHSRWFWIRLAAALVSPTSLAAACRHCGKAPEADDDHSCPCPHPDDHCPDHPEAADQSRRGIAADLVRLLAKNRILTAEAEDARGLRARCEALARVQALANSRPAMFAAMFGQASDPDHVLHAAATAACVALRAALVSPAEPGRIAPSLTDAARERLKTTTPAATYHARPEDLRNSHIDMSPAEPGEGDHA